MHSGSCLAVRATVKHLRAGVASKLPAGKSGKAKRALRNTRRALLRVAYCKSLALYLGRPDILSIIGDQCRRPCFLSDHRHRPPPHPRSRSAHGWDARWRWPWFLSHLLLPHGGIFPPRQVSVIQRKAGSGGSGGKKSQYQSDKAGLSQSTARLLACHMVARLGTIDILGQLPCCLAPSLAPSHTLGLGAGDLGSD